MNKILSICIVCITLFIIGLQSSHALSIKLKKEKSKAEVQIEKTLKEKYEKPCGCRPELEIDWESYTAKEDFKIPPHSIRKISEVVGGLCKEFKTEVCVGLKKIKLKKGKLEASFIEGVLEITREKPSHFYPSNKLKELLESNL